MADNDKELKVTFAPGCFDNFEGTQEELDALMAEIMAMVKDGSILEKATTLDYDSLSDEERAVIDNIIEADPSLNIDKKLH